MRGSLSLSPSVCYLPLCFYSTSSWEMLRATFWVYGATATSNQMQCTVSVQKCREILSCSYGLQASHCTAAGKAERLLVNVLFVSIAARSVLFGTCPNRPWLKSFDSKHLHTAGTECILTDDGTFCLPQKALKRDKTSAGTGMSHKEALRAWQMEGPTCCEIFATSKPATIRKFRRRCFAHLSIVNLLGPSLSTRGAFLRLWTQRE